MGGAVAITMVAALIVAVTPRRSSNTTSISATTAPSVAVRRSDPLPNTRALATTTMTVVPRAISATPAAGLLTQDGAAPDHEVADELPDPDERVIVITTDLVYILAWNDLDQLELGGRDAFIVDTDGALLAVATDGVITLATD